jgi:hypothetical protein
MRDSVCQVKVITDGFDHVLKVLVSHLNPGTKSQWFHFLIRWIQNKISREGKKRLLGYYKLASSKT